jgi:CubicO group peptidase (beta-lactamase class C family)
MVTEWRTASPEAVGMRSEVVSAVAAWLDRLEGSNVHGIAVVRNGLMVFQHYRSGPDECWHETPGTMVHGPDVKHDIRSVTKVVIGLLVGDAVARGLIPNLEMPLFDVLPEYSDLRTPGKDRIRLRHLLTMSPGLEWDENLPLTDPRHGERRLWQADDLLRTSLEPRLLWEPGSVWAYSGRCTELLAAVLRKVSGKPVDAYAREAIFEPLAITDVEWAYHVDGTPSASGGLRLRVPDLAKIGQLVIDGGRREGALLLPATWIEQSLTPQIGMDDRLFFYGFHWWLGRSLVGRREIRWAAGIGLGGQRLFVVPALSLVVVITAGHYADGMQSWLPLLILNRFVLGALA